MKILIPELIKGQDEMFVYARLKYYCDTQFEAPEDCWKGAAVIHINKLTERTGYVVVELRRILQNLVEMGVIREVEPKYKVNKEGYDIESNLQYYFPMHFPVSQISHTDIYQLKPEENIREIYNLQSSFNVIAFIYLLEAPQFDMQGNIVPAYKIGWTSNLVQRLKYYQIALPNVKFITALRGTIVDEQRIQEKFRDLNIGGEWYLKDKSILDYFERYKE